ncbi:hypothetical protein HDU86_005910, partial [Geranomyces michiganensis]
MMIGTQSSTPQGTRAFPRMQDHDRLGAEEAMAYLENSPFWNGPLPTQAHPTDSAGSSEDERASPDLISYVLRAMPPAKNPPPKQREEPKPAQRLQVTAIVTEVTEERRDWKIIGTEDNSYLDSLPDLGDDYESDTSLKSFRSIRSIRSLKSTMTITEVREEVLTEPTAPAAPAADSTPAVVDTSQDPRERITESRASELSIASHQEDIDPFAYVEDALINHGSAFDELDLDIDIPDLEMPSPPESNTSDEEQDEREMSDYDDDEDEGDNVASIKELVTSSLPITEVLEVLDSGLTLSVKFVNEVLGVDSLSALHLLGNKSLLADFNVMNQGKIKLDSRVRSELFDSAFTQLQQCANYPGSGGRRIQCECFQEEEQCNIPSHGIVAALLCPGSGCGNTRSTPDSLQLRLEGGGGKRVSHGHWALHGDEEKMAD